MSKESKENNEETIFKAAIKLKTSAEKIAYIKKACGNDKQLLKRVASLLKAHSTKDDLLDVLMPNSVVSPNDSPLKEGPGTVIDRYKLLEKIGEGGMAVVYMAEQERPVRRKVALKIIKLGMDTEQVIARFEAERQALALMEHSNIAKVFDAGATETGRPYFVMELVEGTSITTYCDENKLGTKERLGLFTKVCNAVQHAHQKGIIHRDLKPSNILITLQDGAPTPKVIDFGIAKATKQRLTEKTLFTRYAQMIGTPAYMSPEQAELSDLEIDIRTDIYSLGILLYELLTGTTPFSEEQLRKAGYIEMQRIICQEEPDKPSTKLTTLGEKLTDIAEHRGSAPDVLTKAVQGDLDWIVMKSIEKNRDRRYETINGLAEDILRHLQDKPVLARPPELTYRLQKFLRRHKSQVAAVLMLTFLSIAIIFSFWMWNRYRHQVTESESFTHRQILARARKSLAGKDFPAALKDAKSILDSKHVGPEAQLLYAGILFENDDPNGAVVRLKNLFDERPEIAGAARALLDRINLETALVDAEISTKVILPPGKTIYVNAHTTGTNDGSSWDNAYKYLQDALAAASRGDVIKVADGVYKPDQGAAITPGDREASFKLKSGVAIYGGRGGESILSGDLNGDDGPNFAGNDENSYHVVTGSGADETAVLDGFTITAGNANGKERDDAGGGMVTYGGNSPTVTNCTFSGNSAQKNGGGMRNDAGSNTIVTRCIFTGNSAKRGGGISNQFSNPIVTNCTFTSNSASSVGGGMANRNCSPVVTDCIFNSNSAEVGGGMSNDGGNPTVANCTFTGNSTRDGAGMVNGGSNPIVTNCTFFQNSAKDDGGGMLNNASSSPTITNCIFEDNWAKNGGGGVSNNDSNPMLTNCIFSGNSTDREGGGMHNYLNSGPIVTNCTLSSNSATQGGAIFSRKNCSSKMTNCILWSNTANNGPQIALVNSSVTIDHCNLQDGLEGIDADPNSSVTGGPGNIEGAPQFVNAAKADYYLRSGSPCIDSGDNSSLSELVVEDVDGNPRIMNGTVDIGAHEYSRLLSPHMRAANPGPSDGATDVTQTAILQWSAGAEAQKHDLYFGTNGEVVRSAGMRSPEYKGTKGLGSESYGSAELESGTTYYWRVDEYNTDAMVSKGRVWSFTVADETVEQTAPIRKEVEPE